MEKTDKSEGKGKTIREKEGKEGRDKKSETEIGNKGLTDKELANLLTKQKKKVTSSTINRWRNGKSNPSGKNKNLFQEWRIERDRWFPKIE